MSIPNNFNFFIPAEISKGKNSKGEEVMKIGGVASTSAVDADGEVLDPNGFQLDYLLKSGYLNWHHQAKTDPTAIVGEPTKAEVTKDGLYIEGLLYPDSKTAQGIYSLAKTLEKRNSSRRLGFSIEGKVLERDPIDNTRVKAAQITGVAITPTPKNPNTLMNIIKGMYVDDVAKEPIAVDPGNEANGGTQYIISMDLPNGDLLLVDKECNVKVVKSITTANTPAITLESVDGDQKNLTEKLSMKKSSSTFRPIGDEEVYSFIFSQIGANDIEKAHMIYKLIKHINQTTDTMAITKDNISKAFELLGIEITEEDFEKAASNDAMKQHMANATEVKTGNAAAVEQQNATSTPKSDAESTQMENLLKADEEEEEDDAAEESGDEMMEDDSEKGMKKGMKKGKHMKKGKDMTELEEMTKMMKAAYGCMSKKAEDVTEDDMEKMMSCAKAMKGMYTAIEGKLKDHSMNGGETKDVSSMVEKSINSVELTLLDRLDSIEKGYTEKAQALGSLNKTILEELNDLKKGYDEAVSRLEELENKPLPQKSKNVQYLKKAFEQAQDEGKRPLTVALNKAEIVQMLDDLAGLGTTTYNKEMSSACMQFEQSNILTPQVKVQLEKAYDVKILG